MTVDQQTRTEPRTRKRSTGKDYSAWRTQEPELIRRWQDDGCERSLGLLLERYKGFLINQVQQIVYRNSISPQYRDDLLQEANLAFIKAVSAFDPARGTTLSTFAFNYVHPALLSFVLSYRQGYRIGTGSDERKAFYAALSVRSARVRDGKSDILDDADIEAIHERTGAARSAVKRAVSSLYTTQTNIEDTDIHAAGGTDTQIGDISIKDAIRVLAPFIETLDERQKAILKCYMNDREIPAQQIGDRFGLTSERIGQIKRDMLEQMANYLQDHGIMKEDVL